MTALSGLKKTKSVAPSGDAVDVEKKLPAYRFRGLNPKRAISKHVRGGLDESQKGAYWRDLRDRLRSCPELGGAAVTSMATAAMAMEVSWRVASGATAAKPKG